jgi:predicted TPR repeat methyltransferase
MPGSARENDQFVIDFVRKHDIHTALDVGCGKGTYSQLLREHTDVMDGIEIWQPYIDEFDLHNQYDILFTGDARTEILKTRDKWYDLVIFGDILEHMTRNESMAMWQEASRIAHWGLISVPIIHYPQGAEYGNPYEVHVQDHLHPEDLRRDYGPFTYEVEYEITGTFIKKFNGSRDEN